MFGVYNYALTPSELVSRCTCDIYYSVTFSQHIQGSLLPEILPVRETEIGLSSVGGRPSFCLLAYIRTCSLC